MCCFCVISDVGPTPNSGANSGAIAAGVVVTLIVVLVVAVLLIGVFLIMKKKGKYRLSEDYAHFV